MLMAFNTEFLIPARVRESVVGNCVRAGYCTGTTNPAMAIAENDDKHPADLVMTDDCRVDRQIW